MTQQELIREFTNFPPEKQSNIIKRLLQIHSQGKQESNNSDEISVEEKMAIVESLAGSLKMENPPMTKDDARNLITEAKAEKYK